MLNKIIEKKHVTNIAIKIKNFPVKRPSFQQIRRPPEAPTEGEKANLFK
jgi:hypothetical protein